MKIVVVIDLGSPGMHTRDEVASAIHGVSEDIIEGFNREQRLEPLKLGEGVAIFNDLGDKVGAWTVVL